MEILKPVAKWISGRLPKDVTSWIILFILITLLVTLLSFTTQMFFRGHSMIILDKEIKVVSQLQGVSIPVGGIIAYTGDLANLPSGYELCDGSKVVTSGSTIKYKPDLNNKFIYGTIHENLLGKSGGNLKHGHTGSSNDGKEPDEKKVNPKTGKGHDSSNRSHIHTIKTDDKEHLPPYVSLAYIIRVK